MRDTDPREPYPRDLVGYGRTPPNPEWPGGARIAVQVVLNYEEGGENAVIHGDAASEAFLSDIVGAAPWPGQRHMNMESIYEYGSRAGFLAGIWRLFTRLGLPLTVYGVATALARNPEAVAAMQEAGWEIASHGLKWIEYKDFSRADEAAHMAEAIRLHTEVTGERPLGWYTGRCSEQTTGLVMEEGGFLYSSDSYADDLPLLDRGAEGGRTSSSPTRWRRTTCATPRTATSPATISTTTCADQLRRALRRGGGGAEDDVDRPPLPPHRPPRQDLRPDEVPRPHRKTRPRLGAAPRGRGAALDEGASGAGVGDLPDPGDLWYGIPMFTIDETRPLDQTRKAAIEAVMRPKLVPYGLTSVQIAPGFDHDGDPAVFIDVEYTLTNTPVDAEVLLALIGEVRDILAAQGDYRYPYIRHHFADDQPVRRFS